MDGLRLGLTAAAVVTAGVGISTAVPAVRAGMLSRTLPRPTWKWLLLDIPIGTVWPEEMLYRGVLGPSPPMRWDRGPADCCRRPSSGCRTSPTRGVLGNPYWGRSSSRALRDGCSVG